jgi:hypothetical protein
MKGRVPTMSGHHSEELEAEQWGITVPTLRRWNKLGKGPKVVKVGRFNMYRDDAAPRALAEQAAAAENAFKPRGRGRPRGSGTAPEPRPLLAAKNSGDE